MSNDISTGTWDHVLCSYILLRLVLLLSLSRPSLLPAHLSPRLPNRLNRPLH